MVVLEYKTDNDFIYLWSIGIYIGKTKISFTIAITIKCPWIKLMCNFL